MKRVNVDVEIGNKSETAHKIATTTSKSSTLMKRTRQKFFFIENNDFSDGDFVSGFKQRTCMYTFIC